MLCKRAVTKRHCKTFTHCHTHKFLFAPGRRPAPPAASPHAHPWLKKKELAQCASLTTNQKDISGVSCLFWVEQVLHVFIIAK